MGLCAEYEAVDQPKVALAGYGGQLKVQGVATDHTVVLQPQRDRIAAAAVGNNPLKEGRGVAVAGKGAHHKGA